VPAEVSDQDGRAILEAVSADPSLEIVVDVERRLVEAPALGISVPFRLDDDARDRLLRGLDDIGVTAQHMSDIDAYEARRPAWLPSVVTEASRQATPQGITSPGGRRPGLRRSSPWREPRGLVAAT